MKVMTAKPYELTEVAAMNNKRGLYESEVGLVRIINASPDQEIEVDFTLYETDRKRFWGMRNVTGKPYECLAYRIKEKVDMKTNKKVDMKTNKKRFRVPVEEYQYYGVYVEAESEEEAIRIVQEKLDGDEDFEYDDEGDGDVRIVDEYVQEIDDKGLLI